MNQEEKLYFEVLSKQCREAWTIFKNPMYRGALEIAQNLYKVNGMIALFVTTSP